MTRSTLCLAVIVYFPSSFPSKTKKGSKKNYRLWYKRCQISIQNKGVLTIRRNTRRTKIGLGWDGWSGARDVGLRTKTEIRKRSLKHGTFKTAALTERHEIWCQVNIARRWSKAKPSTRQCSRHRCLQLHQREWGRARPRGCWR